MSARTLAGAIALIFALGWFTYAEVTLFALPTKAFSQLMDGFTRLKPDDPSPLFTMGEVFTQGSEHMGYLQRRTPTVIPGVVAAIAGFALLQPTKPRSNGGR